MRLAVRRSPTRWRVRLRRARQISLHTCTGPAAVADTAGAVLTNPQLAAGARWEDTLFCCAAALRAPGVQTARCVAAEPALAPAGTAAQYSRWQRTVALGERSVQHRQDNSIVAVHDRCHSGRHGEHANPHVRSTWPVRQRRRYSQAINIQ